MMADNCHSLFVPLSEQMTHLVFVVIGFFCFFCFLKISIENYKWNTLMLGVHVISDSNVNITFPHVNFVNVPSIRFISNMHFTNANASACVGLSMYMCQFAAGGQKLHFLINQKINHNRKQMTLNQFFLFTPWILLFFLCIFITGQINKCKEIRLQYYPNSDQLERERENER